MDRLQRQCCGLISFNRRGQLKNMCMYFSLVKIVGWINSVSPSFCLSARYVVCAMWMSRDCIVSCTRVVETIASCLRSICLVHPGERDKRRVSEIDLFQPRHETNFWWRHNGPVTSQLTDPFKWPNYLSELMGFMYISMHTTKNTWHKDVIDRQMYNCVWYFCTYLYGLSLNGWHASQLTVTTSP